MTTATKSFLGFTVQGDITRSHRQSVTQRPVEEFGPLLQAALDAPGVEAIRWRQYTPYFNDGDVCEFNIYDISVRLTGSAEDAGDYEDGFEDVWSINYYAEKGERPLPEGIPSLKALNSAVSGGAFYDVLLDAFGDHAVVTVTKDGIQVDYYEHD